VARDPGKLDDVPWREEAEVVRADVTDAESVAHAVDGQDVVYYLVHSLHQRDFVNIDREAARTVANAATDARRIVYLGGITPDTEDLSPHLRSRKEVGQIFLDSAVPAIVLNAAIIIGSGSASFEMLRYLTERLPAMITPRWVHNRIQPIAVRDVLHYLVHAAAVDSNVNRAFDIGGPDVLTYLEMMRRYAVVAGLPRRVVVPVPVLTPWLSAQWVNLVTPVPRSIAVPLIESLVHEVVVRDQDVVAYLPCPPAGATHYERAIELALKRIRDADVPTRWSDASAPSDPLPTDPDWAGGSLYTDHRRRAVNASPQEVWRVVEGIGGENGWYAFPLAWALRGWIDTLMGGVGLRRGRRDAARLRVGDSLDFWRVEEVQPPRLLRLRAEMRLPGLAWLEMRVDRDAEGRTVFRQRAVFHPHGLAGHVYWWGVSPFHALVFGGMARKIAAKAESSAVCR
jgi:uncharacterized protein YbjT (DUF2867 family)